MAGIKSAFPLTQRVNYPGGRAAADDARRAVSSSTWDKVTLAHTLSVNDVVDALNVDHAVTDPGHRLPTELRLTLTSATSAATRG